MVKILYKKCFHYVYVFIPEINRNSLDNNIFDKHLPEEQIFDEINKETIFALYEKLKNISSDNHKSLIICDDVKNH